MTKVLLIEDVKEFQGIVKLSLIGVCHLDVASTLAEARAFLATHEYSHLIIDIELPDGNGLEFSAELKNSEKTKNVPITILTTKKDLNCKVLGFQIGIDDYLVKPIDYRELRARLESKMMKNRIDANDEWFSFGCLHLHPPTQRALFRKAGQSEIYITLTAVEFRILLALCKSQGRILSREQILSMTWGENHFGTDRSIDIHICELRKKLGKNKNYIKTIYGCGYKVDAA